MTTSADWWGGAVIYQIYPRSFQDSNADGVGDLHGIVDRLPYVADLGVDAIWMSPFFKSPMRDFGYDVADYRAVDPLFGTSADFDAVIETAHRLGLKVVIDQVLSHTSDQHPWFVESRADRQNPKADWYVWADARADGTPPNNWLSHFGGVAWRWEPRRGQYYLHNFLPAQPDLNFHNPAVRQAQLDNVRYWLDRGVDGVRLDVVNYYFHDAELRSNPPLGPAPHPYDRQRHRYDKSRPENLAFLEHLRALVDRYPGTALLGEIDDDADVSLARMAEYTASGRRLHMGYTFDFLRDGFSPGFVRERLEIFAAAVGGGWPCWSFSNHDVARHVGRWSKDPADRPRLAKLCAALLLSLRGSVCLYHGEELGLADAALAYEDLVDPYGIEFWPEPVGRDGCRTPMPWRHDQANGGFSTAKPWLPLPPDHLALAVDRQTDDPASVLSSYKKLIAFRKRHRAMISGDQRFIHSDDRLLVFARETPNETIFCTFNFSAERATWTARPEWVVTPLDGHGFAADISGSDVHLPPFGVVFSTENQMVDY